MVSLIGLTTALFLQTPALAQTETSVSAEGACFSKLYPLASDMSIQLAKDDFLLDDGSKLWRISSNGFSHCPLDSKVAEAGPLTYLRLKAKDSEVLVAYTSERQRDLAERMAADSLPHLRAGFRPLSKIEKSFIKASNVVSLNCKPAEDQEKAKAEIRKELVGRIKMAETMLKVKNLASVLPLVNEPDYAVYKAVANECSKVSGDVAEQAKSLDATANRLEPKARVDKKTDKTAR